MVVSEKKTDKDGVYNFDDAVNCSNNYQIEVKKNLVIDQIMLKLKFLINQEK